MSSTKKTLRTIFDETSGQLGDAQLPSARRYIAKALPHRPSGSGAWGVFDRKESRFLTDAEIRRIKNVRESFVV